MTSRTRAILGWIPAILVAAFNLFAAATKFMTFPPGSPQDEFAIRVGMRGLEHQLGVLEIIVVTLFLIPRTSTVGFVLMVGYVGGILATDITHGLTFAETSVIYVMLLLLTISAYFRNPELLSRLLKKPVPEKV